jgi:hypothetical protein
VSKTHKTHPKYCLLNIFTYNICVFYTYYTIYTIYLVHRNKQRLTKIHQMLIRMRKLKLKAGPKIVTTNTKIEQREKGRERKALAGMYIY